MQRHGSENELCFLDLSREFPLVFSLHNELLNIGLIYPDSAKGTNSPEPQCECSGRASDCDVDVPGQHPEFLPAELLPIGVQDAAFQ
jgi:hypothetical protein